jgi:Tfp pilus assembly protein FimT
MIGDRSDHDRGLAALGSAGVTLLQLLLGVAVIVGTAVLLAIGVPIAANGVGAVFGGS